MDTEPEVKKEKKQHQHPFYCNICKISCASALNLQTHFLGYKHKTVEEALKSHGIVKTVSGVEDQAKAPKKLPDYVQTEAEKCHGQTLEEQLNTCKETEPALGLDYIIEYRSKDNLILLYECQLCHCQTGMCNMFMHVYGSKHRLAYLKQHYPEIVESDEIRGRGSELNRRLKEVAAVIEKKEGRKQIKIATDPPVLKRKWQEYTYNSKGKVQVLDPSTSKEEKAEGDADKPKQIQESAQSLPSEARKDTQDEQEKKQKEELKPAEKLDTDESSKGNKANENSKADKTERCDDSKESKGEDPTDQVEEKTDDEDSEEFTSNEELLGYLKSFEILSEDDASFILKVTQSLTNALVKYRQQVTPTKDSLNSESKQEKTNERSTKRSDVTSMDITDSNTGFSSNYVSSRKHPAQQPYDKRAAKSNVTGTFMKRDSQSVNISKNHATRKHGSSATEEPYPSYSQNTTSNERFSSAAERYARQNSLTGSLRTSCENDVTTEFFNSVRNMDVTEVRATLQKIAATNTAFRGMDIPNVIRILTESGTIRARNNYNVQ
ncbi:uncharacterized protein LOC102445275 [Pelodiscus sinensis]|uniref:uncharacterized protein LOC102445275 n=1 Tax=Pelodiscus sinensis TaxID=13735 RepID=UPI0003C46C87|nr:uncharacterized protein LOC102445275 [Pelodiscus sinensis]XP_006113116.1 uncharacterized protein LOC102445275 [Pelodiscus sinensis]XP_006113117.1 uncharacterized protein LOC102445275 [Pelodiscus sinensis]XP_014437272.1 uncharacterized protein LOC102445275 [Pelodiscus sinensis]|eukprot:XP_006113115.1 uncharacterized protein LOC102445275 [Pelodiscus sinensis]